MWRKPSRAKSEIVDRMTVVCIGGNPIGCEKPGWEFNFGNDVEAANTVLHCGGDIWMIPNNVYGTMHIGFGEIQRRIAPYGEIGRLLYENLISFYETENASWSAGESWSLGDSPAVGVTLEPNCGSFMYCKAPEVTGVPLIAIRRTVRRSEYTHRSIHALLLRILSASFKYCTDKI